MDFDKVLEILEITDSLVFGKTGKHITSLERDIIEMTWKNQRYRRIAEACHLSEASIKNQAYQLWKLLSEILGEEVRKSNFRFVLERYCQSNQSSHFQIQHIEVQDNIKIQDNYKQSLTTPYKSLGDAPDIFCFYGRTQELDRLKKWILPDKCNLILLLGQGGIGKTTLSIKLIKEIQNNFDYIIWRSLEASPTIENILEDSIKFFSNQQETIIPETLDEKITRLIHYFASSRCLLILDNAESILESGNQTGKYREGYQDYGNLVRRIAESSHQSCLLITSREKPEAIDLIAKKNQTIKVLELEGLNLENTQKIFTEYGEFYGSEDEWKLVIEHYAGNPSALEVVAGNIQEVLGGNLSKFVEDYLKLGLLKFEQINDLYESQFNRLSISEQEIMYWLAINYEPASDTELKEDIISWQTKQELLQSLRSLKRRSLIKKTQFRYTILPGIREYVIARLIDEICQEIKTGEIHFFNNYSVYKEKSTDYIREIQIRLIIQPLIERLLQEIGGTINVENKFPEILSNWQQKYPQAPGYLAGNILNILNQLNEI